MTLITLVLLMLLSPVEPTPPGGTSWYGHGYNKALREAGVTEQLVMVALLPEWSDYSNQVADETFADERVARACQDVIPVKYERDDARLRQLAELFHIQNYPSIVFVNHRGEVEDLIEGYIPAEPLLDQLARITADIGTVSAHQRQVDNDPEDQQARWALLDMLRNVRDLKRAGRLERAIRSEDPEAQGLAGSRLAREALWAQAQAALEDDHDVLDDGELVDHVSSREDPVVRRDGWFEIGNARAGAGDLPGARQAFRAAWDDVDEELAPRLGANLVRFVLQDEQAQLEDDERAWVLAMAETCVQGAEADCSRSSDDGADQDDGDGDGDGDAGHSAAELDRLLAERLGLLAQAQARFAPKRQRRQLAVATARRCVELVPDEPGYQSLLDELLALR